MAPRMAARAVASSSSPSALSRGSSAVAQPASTASPQLLELRRQWKWAAFSQFFYTFASLVALEDVTLVDIEEDLINSTMTVLPRLMQRLLVTLSQDRKITVENWQTALRKQYLRRDPKANPIGVEPVLARHSLATTVEPEVKVEQQDKDMEDDASQRKDDEQKVAIDGTEDACNASPRDEVGDAEGAEYVNEKAADPTCDADNYLQSNAERREEHIKSWTDLTMLEKLESIHAVAEWQFQTPLKLRSVMRSDDENAAWRIEPIGYDAKRNAYWLIGPDRLWIQRILPKSPKKSLKRKATSLNGSRKAKAPRITRVDAGNEAVLLGKAGPLRRGSAQNEPEIGGRGLAGTSSKETRSSRRLKKVEDSLASAPGGSGRARAAKTQANVKLDLQAKQLAATKAEMQSFHRRVSARSSPSKYRALGTRASRRLRGNDDDEWQRIPPEWLTASEGSEVKTVGLATRSCTKSKLTSRQRQQSPAVDAPVTRDGTEKTWLSSDTESELTELSDSETSSNKADYAYTFVTSEHDESEHISKDIPSTESWPLSDFIEWETICVSLQEWATIAQKFEKATHYLEKALYKLLTEEIVPYVTESLREAERQRLKEETLMNRKRSSRIAIKESEKETARLAATKQAEEDERTSRMRRLEARMRKVEEERLHREHKREQRRKEREERERARSRHYEHVDAEMDVDVLTNDQFISATGLRSTPSTSTYAPPKPSRRHVSKKQSKYRASREDWELDCEICGSKGINRDEGVALMSCGKCNKWQHIACHDAVDRRSGRALRNWNVVEFTCRHCLFQNSDTTPSGRALHKAAGSQTERMDSSTRYGGRPVQIQRQDIDPSMAIIDQKPRSGRHPHPSAAHALSEALGLRNRDEIVPAASKKTVTYQPNTSVTFAHYQPLQRGFSPHPTALHPHHQLQPYGAALLSLPRSVVDQNTTGWNGQTRGHAIAPQVNGHDQSSYSSLHTAQSIGIAHGLPPSQPQQSYSMPMNGSAHDHSTETVQHSHAHLHQ